MVLLGKQFSLVSWYKFQKFSVEKLLVGKWVLFRIFEKFSVGQLGQLVLFGKQFSWVSWYKFEKFSIEKLSVEGLASTR